MTIAVGDSIGGLVGLIRLGLQQPTEMEGAPS